MGSDRSVIGSACRSESTGEGLSFGVGGVGKSNDKVRNG